MTERRLRRINHGRSLLFLFLMLALVDAISASNQRTKFRHNWLARGLESRLELQTTIEAYTQKVEEASKAPKQQLRRLEEDVDGGAAIRRQGYPQRVKISPFDLLLAPTPVQLQRADEDLILVYLQELLALFIKAQFGRRGTDTKLEYVLFSDIEENSWNEGKKKLNDPPRTVLRFNGGVASFFGTDIPSEDDINDWAIQAVNELFAASLGDTTYNYIDFAQYISKQDQNSGDYVSMPSKGNTPSQSIQQNAVKPLADREHPGSKGSYLFQALVAVLIAFGIIATVLAIFIWRNNRAVRILCLSNKENEEIVDFSDDVPITISHETSKDRASRDYEAEGDASSRGLASMGQPNANSVKTSYEMDDYSQSSASEFTIPTVSALSFRNPNPFAKGLVAQESFQKERKTHLSKDMLYSSWSANPPDLERYGKNHDDSVLQPSYFNAAIERERLAKRPPSRLQNVGERDALRTRSPLEPPEERATGEGDGIYRLNLTS